MDYLRTDSGAERGGWSGPARGELRTTRAGSDRPLWPTRRPKERV